VKVPLKPTGCFRDEKLARENKLLRDQVAFVEEKLAAQKAAAPAFAPVRTE